MFELRDLRIKAGPEYSIDRLANWLGMSVADLAEKERTPIERLTFGFVAHYLDWLALDIEVLARRPAFPTDLQLRLVPPEGLTLYDYDTMGNDIGALERGGQILRDALETDLGDDKD